MGPPDGEIGEELKRVNSYQWPSGHVAHLTEAQSDALARFKKLCGEKGYYEPGNDEIAPTHDDETLLRYLRARKFLPAEAFKQFKSTEDWRKETQLDALYESIDIEEYDETRRVYPQWTGRRDKRGIPFYVFDVGSLDAKAVSVYSNSKDKNKTAPNPKAKTPWKMLKLFALYENLCRFVLPLCSAIPDRANGETPISQSSNIVDLSGVGFGKMWSLRSHMSDASTLATAHYPETLDRIFVVGAPSFFPTVWQWAQRWFDPITVSKIYILSKSDMTSTLAKFVDMDNIPKKYGGNLDWKFGDMPYLEPAIANSLRWKEDVQEHGHRTLPMGPIKWQYDEDGDLVATAIGTANGTPRNNVIAGLHPESGVARLALSPGRTDRQALYRNTAAKIPDSTAGHTEASKTISSGAAVAVVADSSENIPASVPDTAQPNTTTMSYRDDTTAPPPEPGSVERQGTSSTRFEQQADTHAEGQVADGTPEVKIDGQGEQQGIMDPKTVGQAPKEHELPRPEEPAPSIVEQAKGVASQVVEQASQLPGVVMAAVGMGGGDKKGAEEAPRPKEDPEVDAMLGQNVEEFLRSKTMSQPES